MPKIMIVDDDATIQMELEECLDHMNYDIVGVADNGNMAVTMARDLKPDLILMDVVMPGRTDGISAAQMIKEELDAAVVFITGFGDPEYIERAKLVEPFGYVMKPFDEKEIRGVIEIVLTKRNLELKLKNANRELEREIEERKESVKALRKSEKKFRTLFDTSPHAIAITEIETGKIIDVNDKYCRLMKNTRDEFIGRTTTELGFYSERDRNRFIQELRNSGKVDGFEMDFTAKDGSNLKARIFAVPFQIEGETFLLTEFHDITEQKRLEAQLQQAHKMEAIGTLTGGIAHAYNNLTSIIMGNLSMAMEGAEPGSSISDFLHEANAASCKVRDLTHELMSLAHGGGPVKEVGSIENLMKNATAIIPPDSDISLNKSIPQNLWSVPYDQHKMEAVFGNVLTNAVEAMPQGAALTIKAENFRIEDETQHPSLPLTPGDYVHISIQDQGKGIPEEIRDKIFDPYFSTKARGVQKGMGMGLTTAYAIVKRHGGHFAIDSSPGIGTTVNIYLPAESQQMKVASPASLRGNSTSSVKRVLLRDDEKMLRTLARQILEGKKPFRNC